MTTIETNTLINNEPPKHKNITCLIHYNENDDQSKIFEVLKKFRIEKGLKFSHHKEYIFFTISSEYLGDFYKERPFKISRFQSKSSYKCSKEISDKITAQKDSFIRMIWDEDNERLTFMSRTLPRIHGILVKRIFNDAKEEFKRENYLINKEDNFVGKNNEVEKKESYYTEKTDDFTKVVSKHKNTKKIFKDQVKEQVDLNKVKKTITKNKDKYLPKPKPL